jgi:hypothetical protein
MLKRATKGVNSKVLTVTKARLKVRGMKAMVEQEGKRHEKVFLGIKKRSALVFIRVLFLMKSL